MPVSGLGRPPPGPRSPFTPVSANWAPLGSSSRPLTEGGVACRGVRPQPGSMKKILSLVLLVFLLLLALPPACAQRHIGALYRGDPDAQRAHADAVAAWALDHAGAEADSPGSAFFDAEWSFGTCTMVVMGLGQVALEQPELRERYLPAMESCLDWLMLPESRGFGTGRWGGDGLVEAGVGEHAYLGYLGLALGMHRLLVPESRYASVHDALVEQLAASLDQPVHRFRTYPGETYPVDQSTCAGAVGLHMLATGSDHARRLASWSAAFRELAVDPRSGWLFQRLDSDDGSPADHPRGSGTALAAYALIWADPGLSAELWSALAEEGLQRPLGLGAVREYPRDTFGLGDIDSGPVILGLGVSATGFSLAAARAHGDRSAYAAIARTATLFGLPGRRHGGRWFHSGGAIGNAILLAMLTAPPVSPSNAS